MTERAARTADRTAGAAPPSGARTEPTRRDSLRGLAGLAAAAALPGCGGGGGGGSDSGAFSVVAVQLQLSTGSAAPGLLAPGRQMALQALAQYSTGQSGVVSQQAVWQSSNPAVATVSGAGNVTAMAVGSATITATHVGVTGTLVLRVGTVLETIQITGVGFRAALGIGGECQLFATGQYTDRGSDITALANWTTSNATAAGVGNGARGGVVQGLSIGTTTVGCTLDGIGATLALSVYGHRRLDHDAAVTLATECAIGTAASGAALAVWTRGFSSSARPDLSWSRYRADTGWSTPATMRPEALGTRSAALSLSMNDSGAAVAVWQQPDALYAARWLGDAGWQPAAPVAVPGTVFGPVLRTLVQMDRSGNALLVWSASLSAPGGYLFSWLNAASGTWTAAAPVPGSGQAGTLISTSLVANAAGGAMLVWCVLTTSLEGMGSAILAARWRPPAGGQPGAWETPERVAEVGPSTALSLSACMDESGAVLVAWLRSTTPPAGSVMADTVRVRRYLPASGWQAEQGLVETSVLLPRNIVSAAAAGQGAAVAWTNAYDDSVAAMRMAADGSWAAPVTVSDNSNPQAEVGAPSQLQATMLADGRLLTSWFSSDNAITGILTTRVHQPGSGWLALRRDPHLGRIGSVLSSALTYTPGGLGAAVWVESNQGGTDLFGHTGLVP